MGKEALADDRLNATLQESVLTLLCHDDEQGRVVSAMVDANLFEGDYRVIAERALSYWKRYGKAPAAHMDDELADVLEDANNRKAPTYRRILVAMLHLSESMNVGYVVDRVRTFVRMQQLKAAIIDSAEQLNKNQEVAIDEIEAIWSTMLRSQVVTFDPGTYLSDYEKLLSFMEQQTEFRTGIPELDMRVIVPQRGTASLFLGAAGRGKSWWLVNVGRHAVMDRKKVVHISLEMSEPEVLQRYYQNMFSLTKRFTNSVDLTTFDFSDAKKLVGFDVTEFEPEFSFESGSIREELDVRVTQYPKRFRNLIIKRFPPRAMDVRTLNAYLDNLEVAEHFIPDMLILDYMGLWSTDAKNHRISLGRAFEDFRGVCVARNVAGMTAHQLSKEGAASFAAGVFNVAEDWSMIGTADQALVYSCTEYEFKRGLARLHVGKARGEQDRFTVLLTQNYQIGQFRLASMLMPSEYEDLITALRKTNADDHHGGDDDDED